MTNEAQRIPTLLTLDVHDLPGIDRYIERSAQVLSDMGIPATYFVPAQMLICFFQVGCVFSQSRFDHRVALSSPVRSCTIQATDSRYVALGKWPSVGEAFRCRPSFIGALR